MPTATYTPTPTIAPALPPFFEDDFDGDTIDSSLWYTETADLSVQDGYLYIPPVVNESQDFADLRIEAKLDRQFSVIEFSAAVLHSEKHGYLSILTSCYEGPSANSLEVSLGYDNDIWGGWGIVDPETGLYQENDEWKQPLELGQVYNVRLVQDGDVVRAYVDDVEMPQPYPCTSMGKWLVVRGGTFPGGFVEGYFDYVRLWAPTSTPSPTPSPTPLPTTITAADGAAMILIPAGPFMLGSESDDSEEDEQPVHEVTLDDYYIDQYEVTNERFAAFVTDTGHVTDAEQRGESYVLDPSLEDNGQMVEGAYWKHPVGPTSNVDGLGNHPVVHVSWNDAVAYCEWRGDRLPTEAEWEKAARGDDGRTYPWGNTFYGNRLNYCDSNCRFDYADSTWDDGFANTAPVGSYPDGAGPFGVLDMAGNVGEWVADWYAEDYYAISPSENPPGPSSGDERVHRGGGWPNGDNHVRATFRNSGWLHGADNYLGFRCARTP
ncbi:MAG: formylglycine-generating enzyme family protein [Anaerolineales bacterium]|nr:formylglycine-generating enzyme family protein [Anaerolineales bacterium]